MTRINAGDLVAYWNDPRGREWAVIHVHGDRAWITPKAGPTTHELAKLEQVDLITPLHERGEA